MTDETQFPYPQLWQYVVALMAMMVTLMCVGIAMRMLQNLFGMQLFLALGYQILGMMYYFGQYGALFRRDLDATCLSLGFCILATLAAAIGTVAVPLVELPSWPESSPSDWWILWLPIVGVFVLSLAAMLANFRWKKTLEAAQRQNLQPPVMPKQSLMDIMHNILIISVVLGGWNGARMWYQAFEKSLSP